MLLFVGVTKTQQAGPTGALRIAHQAQDFERVAYVDGDDALTNQLEENEPRSR
jgi:hypothetical protein